jgi:thioredoxin reductase (NADPH)
MTGNEHHQVVVVGGGPAGVSCALECADIQLDVVLLDAGHALGGQVADIPHVVHNVVFAASDRGTGLRRSLERSSLLLGARVRSDHAVTAADLGARWVETAKGRFSADALVIATGALRRTLPAAPDGAFGGDVTYQLEREPGRFAGRPVAVVGGGDSATLDALELARGGSPVFLLHRSAQLTARRDLVGDVRREPLIEDLAGWEVEAVEGTGRIDGIRVVRLSTGERRHLPVGGLVVKISTRPATDVFAGQLALDGHGAVVVDPALTASAHGVFAAGDVTAGAYPRLATALGQGVLAARSVLRHLEALP